MLLTRYVTHIGRLYAFDLAGAGIGSVLVLAVFSPLGGSGAVVAAAAVACQPSIVLTTDADDMNALLAAAELAMVIPV